VDGPQPLGAVATMMSRLRVHAAAGAGDGDCRHRLACCIPRHIVLERLSGPQVLLQGRLRRVRRLLLLRLYHTHM
jgi:hypothetical protein